MPLVAQWQSYVGGPAAAVTGATITITNIATGAVALATTSAGVNAPGIGLNSYSWAVGSGQAAGDYLVAWAATSVATGAGVSATEVVQVTAAATGVYGDLATLKAMLGITDTTRDTLLSLELATAAQQINDMCGRSFNASTTTATSKIIVAGNHVDHQGNLRVPDIGDVTGLVVETGSPAAWSTTVATAYYAAPENAIAAGNPVTWLRSGYLQTPWSYNPYVRVTARWGWPATPAPVTKAALLLASRLYARRLSPEGVIGSQDWGGIRVARTDADVIALLSPYMLPGFA
jgi:hypothetical protein